MKRGRERRWPWRPTFYARKGERGKPEVGLLSIITPVPTSGLTPSQMKKLGSLESIVGMLPAGAEALKGVDLGKQEK
jgi:hypothetical protein